MKPSLVVLAAGMGSRYGSLKQIDSFGPSGETIIDYSIYDAIEVGFEHIVFVIRKDKEKEFKELYGEKYGSKAKISFVYQELDKVPAGFDINPDRVKPWGTAHAVLMAKEVVDNPYAIINGDDFYGRNSFKAMFKTLSEFDNNKLSACLLGYVLKNTLSDHGHVSRGICETDASDSLQSITERTNIVKASASDIYFEEDTVKHPLTGDEIVSMNLMGFTAPAFQLIEDEFKKFLKEKGQELKSEFYIPFILDKIREMGIKVPVIQTDDVWFGVTYNEDKPVVKQKLKELVDAGIYPSKLW